MPFRQKRCNSFAFARTTSSCLSRPRTHTMNRLYPASRQSLALAAATNAAKVSRPSLAATAAVIPTTRTARHSSSSSSSQPPPRYPAHVPLHTWQKQFLSIGSTLASLVNPSRGDMIALLSETSGERHLPALLDEVMRCAEGRALMIDRPRITSQSVDMEHLRSLPPNTFGQRYTQWLDWCRVGPDTRAQVRRRQRARPDVRASLN